MPKSFKRSRGDDEEADEDGGSSRKRRVEKGKGRVKGKRVVKGKGRAGSSSKTNLTADVKPVGPVVPVLLKVCDFLSYLTLHSK